MGKTSGLGLMAVFWAATNFQVLAKVIGCTRGRGRLRRRLKVTSKTDRGGRVMIEYAGVDDFDAILTALGGEG